MRQSFDLSDSSFSFDTSGSPSNKKQHRYHSDLRGGGEKVQYPNVSATLQMHTRANSVRSTRGSDLNKQAAAAPTSYIRLNPYEAESSGYHGRVQVAQTPRAQPTQPRKHKSNTSWGDGTQSMRGPTRPKGNKAPPPPAKQQYVLNRPPALPSITLLPTVPTVKYQSVEPISTISPRGSTGGSAFQFQTQLNPVPPQGHSRQMTVELATAALSQHGRSPSVASNAQGADGRFSPNGSGGGRESQLGRRSSQKRGLGSSRNSMGGSVVPPFILPPPIEPPSPTLSLASSASSTLITTVPIVTPQEIAECLAFLNAPFCQLLKSPTNGPLALTDAQIRRLLQSGTEISNQTPFHAMTLLHSFQRMNYSFYEHPDGKSILPLEKQVQALQAALRDSAYLRSNILAYLLNGNDCSLFAFAEHTLLLTPEAIQHLVEQIMHKLFAAPSASVLSYHRTPNVEIETDIWIVLHELNGRSEEFQFQHFNQLIDAIVQQLNIANPAQQQEEQQTQVTPETPADPLEDAPPSSQPPQVSPPQPPQVASSQPQSQPSSQPDVIPRQPIPPQVVRAPSLPLVVPAVLAVLPATTTPNGTTSQPQPPIQPGPPAAPVSSFPRVPQMIQPSITQQQLYTQQQQQPQDYAPPATAPATSVAQSSSLPPLPPVVESTSSPVIRGPLPHPDHYPLFDENIRDRQMERLKLLRHDQLDGQARAETAMGIRSPSVQKQHPQLAAIPTVQQAVESQGREREPQGQSQIQRSPRAALSLSPARQAQTSPRKNRASTSTVIQHAPFKGSSPPVSKHQPLAASIPVAPISPKAKSPRRVATTSSTKKPGPLYTPISPRGGGATFSSAQKVNARSPSVTGGEAFLPSPPPPSEKKSPAANGRASRGGSMAALEPVAPSTESLLMDRILEQQERINSLQAELKAKANQSLEGDASSATDEKQQPDRTLEFDLYEQERQLRLLRMELQNEQLRTRLLEHQGIPVPVNTTKVNSPAQPQRFSITIPPRETLPPPAASPTTTPFLIPVLESSDYTALVTLLGSLRLFSSSAKKELQFTSRELDAMVWICGGGPNVGAKLTKLDPTVLQQLSSALFPVDLAVGVPIRPRILDERGLKRCQQFLQAFNDTHRKFERVVDLLPALVQEMNTRLESGNLEYGADLLPSLLSPSGAADASLNMKRKLVRQYFSTHAAAVFTPNFVSTGHSMALKSSKVSDHEIDLILERCGGSVEAVTQLIDMQQKLRKKWHSMDAVLTSANASGAIQS